MLRSFRLTVLSIAIGELCAAQLPAQAPPRGVSTATYTTNMLENSQAKVPPVLSGRVIREDQQPVGDATVSLVCEGVNRGSAAVKTNGEFSLVVQRPEHGSHFLTLSGCEIFAIANGAQSQSRAVRTLRDAETDDVGSLVINPGAKSVASTVSVKSLLAPAEAKRRLNKGKSEAAAQRWSEAEKHLSKATEIFPSYAEAWHELGLVLQREGKRKEAHDAFEQALAADPVFVRPYFGLVGLSADIQDWPEMQRISQQADALAADPLMLFYNAIASFNLGQFDAAEKSLLRAAAIDTQHQVPQVDLLLSDILIQRRDYPGAAAHVRQFLAHAPDSSQAQSARVELDRLENLAGGH